MPLYRRLPKRGFTNRNTKDIVSINVEELNRFEDGAVVTVEALLEAGVIKRAGDGVKVLGNGELTKKLDEKVNRYSASAIEKIKALGGTAEVI
jgi:large subunit ribosomal protein L15